MNKDKLLVRFNGSQIGILEKTVNGKMTFTYNYNAIKPISIAMPIIESPYNEMQTEAFFGGLLPESETAKKIIAKKYGISHSNNFELLKAIGYDCAGAISCHTMDDSSEMPLSFKLTGNRIISEDELYKHIKDLPKNPLFLGIDGLRLSLAGVQDKAAVCLIDNKIALAENGCPTTHILKPASTHFEGLVENEYFCLSIAKHLGLPVPNVQLRRIKDITFLLIERYDRKIINNYVERIHQEDFCQALSIPSSRKYQNEGGPCFKECFEILNKTGLPAIDRNELVSALVFNYLVGNMDAHAKNFSLLHHLPTYVRLAPFYDIVCTSVYSNLSKKMAMKIGSKYEMQNLFPRHWEQLCNDVHYRYRTMKDCIMYQAELILKLATKERKSILEISQTKIIDEIIRVIEKNIERTLKRFQE